MRINRFLAGAGLGSRRAVERLVREGRVTRNGAPVVDLSTQVEPEHDQVTVDGQPVRWQAAGRLVLLHKPVGVVSSLRSHGAEPCLRDLLPDDGPRLFHVGRLDRDSSGLLLLTDDGDLAQAIQHPRGEVWKTYAVTTVDAVPPDTLTTLRDGGLSLDGRPCLPMRVESRGPRDLVLGLREGRNRQIRRMLEMLGTTVVRLHRTAVGPLQLGALGVGKLRDATPEERRALDAVVGNGRD